MEEELLYRIAITLIPGVGDKLGKTLIAHCGSAKAVFSEKAVSLQKIPGIGAKGSRSITKQQVLHRAEQELLFIQKEGIRPLFYLNEDYPQRLKLCEDGPLMLYYRGNVDLNRQQAVAVIGTRNATEYGKAVCAELIEQFKVFDPLIVSGLAYGIDICAHRESLKQGLSTIGVLAHGHDRIYPSIHRESAKEMMGQGGLLTDYISQTNPDRENFPKRNRIVAGMVDAVIVVEAARKGGALITAEIANSYNREVFAVPGNLGNSFSEGCNLLIKQNKAALLSTSMDLKYILGWEELEERKPLQKELFTDLNMEEKKIWEFLSVNGKKELHIIGHQTKLSVGKLLQHLMSLELKGVIKSYPGKLYALR